MFKFIIIGLVILVVAVLLARMFGRRRVEPARRESPKMLTVDGGAVAAEIDGQELDIDPDVLAGIGKLVAKGYRIEAIKLLREATGLGLAEATKVVESLERMQPK